MEAQVHLKRRYVLIALMLTLALAAMDSTIVATVIPQIVSDLGGFNKFSWVFSIYLLAQTVTIPIYGKLSDIFGRKVILIIGICIFLVGSALSAAAWDISSLIAFRGIQGLGAGSIMASVNTIAGDIYTVQERAMIQGWLSSIWGISAVIGPALGGALAEYISWRWIFIVNLPIGAVGMIFLIVFFKEQIVPRKHKIDYLGAVLILITVGLLIVYMLEGGQSWPWLSWQSYILIALVILLIYVTIRVESRASEPIIPAWVWKNRTFAFTNIATLCMGISMMAPDTYMPTFSQVSLGLGVIASGFLLSSMSIGWPTASALSGRLYLKIGFRNTALIGAGLVAVSFVSFLFIPWPQPVFLVVLMLVFLGAGFGLFSTPSLVGIQSMVGWEDRGVVTGLNMFCRNLGQSLGATIVGAIFNNSFRMQMQKVPVADREDLNHILEAIRSPEISAVKKQFLEQAVSNSTIYIFAGATFFAMLLFVSMYLVPKSPVEEKKIVFHG